MTTPSAACTSLTATKLLLLVAAIGARSTLGFLHDSRVGVPSYPKRSTMTPQHHPVAMVAKGFGSSSSSSNSNNNKNKNKVKNGNVKKVQETIRKKYGTNVAEGTQRRIDEAMSALPIPVQMAAQLYQRLQQYEARCANLSVLQQAQLDQAEVDGARRARIELDRLCREHDLKREDLHNLFQRLTWDASADAKAARAVMAGGDMPLETRRKVERVCQIVASAVSATSGGRCLDVGCGHGVLIPYLLQAGLEPYQIHGIDLSPEMIKNARQQHHPAITFEAVDFLKDFQLPNENDKGKDQIQNDDRFESIVFLSSLHDFSDMTAALQKAAGLLKPQGKLIVAHPQGASHVARQSHANPVLVKRGLPTAQELGTMHLPGMRLEIEPATPNSPLEATDGYLAVWTKEEE